MAAATQQYAIPVITNSHRRKKNRRYTMSVNCVNKSYKLEDDLTFNIINNRRHRRKRNSNLIQVNISKPGPPAPKIIPKCLVINARSLAKPDAASALNAELSTNNVDICIISETWLTEKIQSSLICPSGYTIVRKDRSAGRHGGGVAIVCRNDWKVKKLDLQNNFECLWCEIETKNSNYHIGAIYHPPDPDYLESDLLDQLSDSCEQILLTEPNARIIIAGDINQLKTRDLCNQYNLEQMVKKFTRGQRILDVFLTNCPHLWKQPTVLKCLVRSDHLAVMVTPKILAKPERTFVYFRDVRHHRKINMENKLKACDWSNIYAAKNVEEAVLLLNKEIVSMFNESFPLIKIKSSTRDPPYMSPLVKHLCKIRNKQIHRGADTKLQEKINQLIRENQIRAVSNENNKNMNKCGTKDWWNTVNKITGRGTTSHNISSIIDPNVINAYFQNINTDTQYTSPQFLTIPDDTRIPKVNVETVEMYMTKQKRTSPGPDELPYWLWKDFAHYLAPVLTNVLNLSLHEQCVPSLWKLANISPIQKESTLSDCNQLRPISLTNIIIRLFEKIIFKEEILKHTKSIIGPDQFAYKKGTNTTSALIKCQYNWLKWLDEDAEFVRVISFDFSKAFDSVPHDIVTEKLKQTHLNPYIINWIISFLKNRKQRVVVDGITTEYLDINKGVPQGTVLGPFLFSLMVDDIKSVEPETNLLVKFADDITVSAPVKSTGDSAELETRNIENWARNNRMTLNLSKTWEMLLSGGTSKPPPAPIEDIERKKWLKLLGVTLEDDVCCWDLHVDALLSKAGSRMYILRVCRRYGYQKEHLNYLFNSLILSLFLYGIEMWGSALQKKYLERIDKFFKCAYRYGYLLEKYTMSELIETRDRILFNRILNNPEHVLYELLPEKRQKVLRKREHPFILPKVRTERFKRSFINRCLFDYF